MRVDMRALFREGRFGAIDQSITRAELAALLGPPETWGPAEQTEATAVIWLYGSIEFHFEDEGSNRLRMIFSDHLHPFIGWRTITIDPWIVSPRTTQELAEEAFRREGIAYHPDPRYAHLYRTEGFPEYDWISFITAPGVTISFYRDEYADDGEGEMLLGAWALELGLR